MEKQCVNEGSQVFSKLAIFMRKFMFKILSVGAIPNHIAFILDGNRRYAKKHRLSGEGAGHIAGFWALIRVLIYCSELSVKYVTIYAFSIDNFKRRQTEVQYLMDFLLEKMEMLLLQHSLVAEYGIRVRFIGNLGLLSEPIRVTAEKVMRATAKNTKMVILICVAYASTDEIAHAVEESCNDEMQKQSGAEKEATAVIELVDIEKHVYMGVAPDPDILVRTSGENRLSNFLLWQTSNCMLYAPAALWPEIGFWHLVWAILNYQRRDCYLDKKKKQL